MDDGMIVLRAPLAASSARASLAETSSGLQGARRKLAIACVLAALVLVVHAAAIVNVALPALARSLHTTPAAALRVITAHQLALVMALLPCAALGESLGHRRVFTAGVALFTGASAACALAPSLPWLLVARFAQGLGGAAVMALGVALLRLVVSQRQLAAAIGWNALGVALSSAAAPAIGALILWGASLPWLFAIHVPLGAAVLLATRALPEEHGSARELDVIAIALNAAAFAALIVGAELVPTAPQTGGAVLAAAALVLALLIRRELPKQAPLVPLDLLRARSFRISVLASVLCFTGQTAALVALPFELQHRGQDLWTTGLMITPWPLSVALMAQVAGRLADRVSSAALCAVGGACLALGLGAAALWPLQREPLALVPFIALCGAGFGLFQVPNNRNMLLAAPRARSGAAGGMQGTARLLGQSMGALVISSLFVLTPAATAPRIGLGIAAALTLSAGLVSVLRAEPKAGEVRPGVLRP